MLKYLFVFSCFLFSLCAEQKYILTDMGTLSYSKAECLDINDRGQALLRLHEEKEINWWDASWAVWDPEKGLIPVDMSEAPYPYFQFQKITNSGELIALKSEPKRDDKNVGTWAEWQVTLTTWTPDSGFKSYSRAFSLNNPINGFSTYLALGHNDYVAGTYGNTPSLHGGGNTQTQIFILEKGNLRNFSLEELFRSQGYEPISLSAVAVNENGDILGKFSYKQNHPFKDTSVQSEFKPFLWRNGVLNVIDVSKDDSQVEPLDVNNNGVVLLKFYRDGFSQLALWNEEEGFFYETPLKSFLVEGYCTYSLPQEGFVYEPSFYGMITNLEPIGGKLKYCDRSNYPGIYFKQLQCTNRSGQLAIQGQFMGEEHPFLLTPID